MALHEITEGWTAPIDFWLEADGQAVDLSNITLTLIMRDKTGELVTIQGTIVPDADQVENRGKLLYTPHANDLVLGENEARESLKISDAAGSIQYFERRARFRATDSGSKVAYFPHGRPDVWQIHEP